VYGSAEPQSAIDRPANAVVPQFILRDALKKLNRTGEARAHIKENLVPSKQLGTEHEDWMTAAKNTVEERSPN
jgi:hypothetical protein